MRVLWVKAGRLLPVHNGGNIRSYHLLRYLQSRHSLTFLSYYDGPRDLEYERELRAALPGAVSLCTGRSISSPLARGFDYALNLPRKAPYAVHRFASRVVKEHIVRRLEEGSCDVAVCDFLDAAVNFPATLPVPAVLFQHNVESEIWRRKALTESHLVRKAVWRLEFEKMLRYEEEAVGRFQHVIAVSEHDRSLMLAWADASRISVVPTGVDVQQYRAGPGMREVEPLVVFVGAMDWEPNVDAVEYFCSAIWPGVQHQVPSARFRIVGRNPDGRVRALESESVEVTGSVLSVVEHLRAAAVVVVPLRIGGGTRLKIYEAMAMSKAVVSTTIGAEGLDVHDGEDIMLADDAGAFAEAVVGLLQSPEQRWQYEKAAHELATRYDWPVIGEKFSQVLEQVAFRRGVMAEPGFVSREWPGKVS